MGRLICGSWQPDLIISRTLLVGGAVLFFIDVRLGGALIGFTQLDGELYGYELATIGI